MKFQLLIGLLIGFILVSCRPTTEANEKENPQSELDLKSYVKMAPVIRESASSTVDGLGVIISKTEAKPSFKTGGVVEKTFFKEGDFVKAGSLLATLILDEINAQVQQAAEGVTKAERDLARAQNLYADSVATLEQVQNATTALNVARKNHEIAEFNQKYSEVRAPISGKIVAKLLRTGEIAGPGMPVAVILGVGQQDWRVKMGLIASEWGQIEKGLGAEVRLEAFPGQVFKAFVSDKAVMTTDGSGTLDIELTLKDQPPSLAAGMIGKIEIPLPQSTSITTIPIDALVKTNGEQGRVFTIRQGVAHELPIEIFRILGDQVMVGQGLEEIDSVVTIGSVYLEEGDKVSVANR